MIEIYPNLYIGRDDDRALLAASTVTGTAVNGVPEGWFIISAAKTAHKAELGYTGNTAPKTTLVDGKEVQHPEYLIARRARRLILNLIDVPDPAYIWHEIMEAALAAIDDNLLDGRNVLVHCNQGHSRAPGIGLLWLHHTDDKYRTIGLDAAEAEFKAIYPDYAPAAGVRGYLQQHWDD